MIQEWSLSKRITIAFIGGVIGFLMLNTFIIPSVDEAINQVSAQNYAGIATLLSIYPLVYTLSILIWIIYIIFGYSQDSGIEFTPDNSYWVEYGDRLKLAYASKFGGENKAFTEEVDSHVSIMEHCGAGFTRALAKDWLKRMHGFTESK